MRVRDFMTVPVITIRADKKLIVVDEIMRGNNIKHLPVVDPGNRLIGVLSHRDLMEVSVTSLAVKIATAERRQHLAAGTVEQVMRREVISIGPDASIQEAAALMRQRNVGCLPVVEADRVIGILTLVDLARLVERLPADLPVAALDSPSAVGVA